MTNDVSPMLHVTCYMCICYILHVCYTLYLTFYMCVTRYTLHFTRVLLHVICYILRVKVFILINFLKSGATGLLTKGPP